MDHIAIDLGGKESQICVRRGDDGTVLEEKRVRTSKIEGYLSRRPPSLVIVEAAAGAFHIADVAKKAGHQVRVVAATLAPSLGVGHRGVKNDRQDALNLSMASCRMDLPSVHIPTEASRQLKSELGIRESQVKARTELINTVHGWLRNQGKRVPSGAAETVAKRLRAKAERDGIEIPRYVERQLLLLEVLNAAIKEADVELKRLAAANPVCARLQSVPGIGPINSLCFVATLDDVTRFGGAHQVESYLGLTPGEHSSGQRVQKTSITKAGSARMRKLLVQASWSARRTRPNDPMVLWAAEVEKRRGKRVATVALARKLGGILFAIWRDGTVYQPDRAARKPAAVTQAEPQQAQALALLSSVRRM